jgi:hypothetical protein
MSFFFDVLPASLGLAAGSAAATGATVAPGLAAGSVAALSAAAPVAASASTASTLLTTASLLGTGITAAGQLQSSKAEADALEANAAISQNEAEQVSQATKEKTLQISRERNRMLGAQNAAYGASGLALVGSPLEVMAQTASEYERDILMTGYTGEIGRTQKVNEAGIYDWSAQQKRKTGRIAAGSTLLTGFGKMGYSKLGSQNYYVKV